MQSTVELGMLAPTGLRQSNDADTLIRRVGLDGHEPVALEVPQKSAEVAGIKPESFSNRANVDPVLVDLPQHPRGSEWPAPRQILVVEDANALGDCAIEFPNPEDIVASHISDFSQRFLDALEVRLQR